ncbi:BREX-6 system BrxE protein [Polyangium sorediatum]|uniref:BREX-6 system BrxE protein n=1 Tax=Polyangium sorediatum TaxID=889274 RepID=A0ABT6P327_9BACT|nr:BREX-6 system BrxE protein [Polyangium sorediatum]MDI1434926.1 BREX-6 system BrxE protein [Polyangium sorediatum]
MPHVPDAILDQILALQFTVAWAGEGLCEPRRLGWWETDLVDEAGGGDLFARLTPRTRAWASLEAVREAARRVDAKARGKLADPDSVRSLFFLGFEIDEQLGDRLAVLKRDEENPSPAKVLALPLSLDAEFSRDKLTRVLAPAGEEKFAVTPAGRQLKGPMPKEPEVLVRRLAAALVPLAEQYPLPYFQAER